MISIDTNILLPAAENDNKDHTKAANFVESLKMRADVAISEFILVELYLLLRNPTVVKKPFSAKKAVMVCASLREHPRWQIVGFPNNSRAFHDRFWSRLGDESFARRRAYDWRTASSLLEQGVTEFATVNLKDFQDFGFSRVWNPLQE